MTIALLAQLGAGGGMGGGNVPQPTGIHPAWLALPILLTLVAFALCFWLMWRVRTLVRAVHELKSDSDKPVHVPGPFGFLRFKLRTLIILLTVVAIPLGMFMAEFRRAQRQASVMDAIRLNSLGGFSADANYRIGSAGNSRFGSLLCNYVHSDFSCHLKALSISYDDLGGGTSPVEIQTWGQIDLLEQLPELEVLSIRVAMLFENDIKRLAKLPNLRKLQLVECDLTPTGVKHLFNLGRLEHLELVRCGIVDHDLVEIQPNTHLKHLDLMQNEIEGKCLGELANLQVLETLILARNPTDFEPIFQLAKLSSLKHLYLAFLDVTKEQSQKLAELHGLQRLNLSPWGSFEDTIKVDKFPPKLVFKYKGEDTVGWQFFDNRPSLNNGNGFNGAYSGSLFNGGGQF